MKKIIAFTLLGMAAIAASAQDMYDGLLYSDVNQYGTARSISLGNAMTALGGDLGSITINPAGSAVAGYSQFTITPSLSISSVRASYAPVAYQDFTAESTTSYTKFALPNMGFVFDYQTGRSYGLKSMSFGIVCNASNIYADRMDIVGKCDQTSMMGAMGAAADGIHSGYLQGYNSGYGTWTDVLAYQSGMIATYMDAHDDSYVGASEQIYDEEMARIIRVGGPLYQNNYRQRSGSRNDLVLNMGMNFSDRLFLGVNIGVPYLNYTESISQTEEAVNTSDFPLTIDGYDTYFDSARERYALAVNGTGIYAKLGVIFLPVDGLRIGAAVQTPTLMTITERYRWDAVCNFVGYNGTLCETPDGEYTYNLTTPASFNVGAAYTIGQFGLVSADFERTKYRRMKFSDYHSDGFYSSADSWSAENSEILNYAGSTNIFRLGAEARITPNFSLRAGYNYKVYSSPDYKDVTQAFSFGAGYASNGAFFADAAVRSTIYPQSWYYPYDDYLDDTRSPEIMLDKTIFDIVLTVGWRF